MQLTFNEPVSDSGNMDIDNIMAFRSLPLPQNHWQKLDIVVLASVYNSA